MLITVVQLFIRPCKKNVFENSLKNNSKIDFCFYCVGRYVALFVVVLAAPVFFIKIQIKNT